MSKSIFEGIEAAKARRDSNYLTHQGEYILRINRCKSGENRKGEAYLAIEMEVLWAFDWEKKESLEEKYHRPGEEVTHMLMLKHDAFLGNLKTIFSKLAGVHSDDVTEQDCVDATNEELQPFAELIVLVGTRMTKTRAGNPFTVVNYKSVLTVPEIDKQLVPHLTDEQVGKLFPGDSAERLQRKLVALGHMEDE